MLARVLYWEPNDHVEVLGKVWRGGACSVCCWDAAGAAPATPRLLPPHLQMSEEPDMLVRTYMSQPHKDAAKQVRGLPQPTRGPRGWLAGSLA